jgi:hypothetical protein
VVYQQQGRQVSGTSHQNDNVVGDHLDDDDDDDNDDVLASTTNELTAGWIGSQKPTTV